MKNNKKEDKSLNFKKIVIIFFSVLFIILVFAFVDYFFHSLSNEYAVPSYYFRNKIIAGTILGFIIYLFIRKQTPIKKAVIFSAIISVSLQIRYYFEGFSLDFVIEFLFIHFFILLIVSWVVFRIIRKYL